MRIYDKNKKLIKIVCNKCGHQVNSGEGVLKEEFLSVEKQWGYFSDKDGEIHSFDLCEACYNSLLSSFIYPIQSRETTEIL